MPSPPRRHQTARAGKEGKKFLDDYVILQLLSLLLAPCRSSRTPPLLFRDTVLGSFWPFLVAMQRVRPSIYPHVTLPSPAIPSIRYRPSSLSQRPYLLLDFPNCHLRKYQVIILPSCYEQYEGAPQKPSQVQSQPSTKCVTLPRTTRNFKL